MDNLVVGLIMALVGSAFSIFVLKNKNTLLNIVQKNSNVINEVKNIDSQIATNNIALSEEEAKRNSLKRSVENGTICLTQQELLDTLNKELKK